jgi:hypothetical protein
VEPHDKVVRDDLKNPFWIEQEDHVGDGPKKKLIRYRPFPGMELIKTNNTLFFNKKVTLILKP